MDLGFEIRLPDGLSHLLNMRDAVTQGVGISCEGLFWASRLLSGRASGVK